MFGRPARVFTTPAHDKRCVRPKLAKNCCRRDRVRRRSPPRVAASHPRWRPRNSPSRMILDPVRLPRNLRPADRRATKDETAPMAGAITNSLRLAKAGVVLAQHGVRFVPPGTPVPLPLRLARIATAPIRLLAAPFRAGEPREARLSSALTSLGPSYIKLGQFLATRPDVIGPDLAGELALLQDNLPPFSMAEARHAVEEVARRQARGSFRRVRPRRRRRLHRPGAQGGRRRCRRPAARGRREDPAPRHRAAVPPRPRQLLLRRPPHRAPA